MVKDLKQRDCGITGVGFQLHIELDFDDHMIEGVRKNIQRYNELGLTVHFTEMDIKCNPDQSW
jgi:endo-1,4-beta-xylanase